MLSIGSICRDLPNPDNPTGGIFVQRRLAAMARRTSLEVIQPIPYFPVLAPSPRWSRVPQREVGGLRLQHQPMFYVPKYLKSLDGLWLYRSIVGHLARMRRSGRLDVIDAHFAYPEGIGALLAAKRIGVPCFVTLRGLEAEYIHKTFIGPQIRHLLRNADGCICVSHFLQDLAIEHGAPRDKTCVVHNAIDSSLFHVGERPAARRAVGLPTGDPIIVSVGHLTRRKRHHVLLRAFAQVLRSRPNARLLIIGAASFEADYPGYLHKLASELGVDGAVSFLGNLDSTLVAEYLRAADVFALGTQREGCCNAILEALACGCPVVTTPVGDNARFVKDGENGYIVPVDEVEAMARGIELTLDRTDWCPERIAATLGVGDWDGVAAKVIEFFSQRLNETSARSLAAHGG